MKVKRFVADNMQLALKMVSAELGPDAVIVSSRRLDNGMEVVASSEMLGEIDTAKQSELDRQLRLQRELEAAKQAARASAAKTHLTETDLSIAEIGEAVGFTDPTVFSRAFKNWTGQSPRQYRQQNRS